MAWPPYPCSREQPLGHVCDQEDNLLTPFNPFVSVPPCRWARRSLGASSRRERGRTALHSYSRSLKFNPFWILDITRFLLFQIESKIGRRFSWIFLNFKLNLLKLLFQICKVWAVYAKLNHRRLSLTLYLGVETFNFKAESSDKTMKWSTCLHIFLVKLDCSLPQDPHSHKNQD